jgi:hypothetical protein
VIAKSGGQHGVLDLLAATKSKRLAILGLKATENPVLPLQAADYWKKSGNIMLRATWRDTVTFRLCNYNRHLRRSIWLCRRSVFHPTTDTIFAVAVAGTRNDPRGIGGELAPRVARGHAPINCIMEKALSCSEGRSLPSRGFAVEFSYLQTRVGSRDFLPKCSAGRWCFPRGCQWQAHFV